MDIFSLVIAIIALVVATKAFQGIGDIQVLRQQIEEVNAKIEPATKGPNKIDQDMQEE